MTESKLEATELAAETPPRNASGEELGTRRVRAEDRTSYPYVQCIAQLHGDRWPHRSEFVPMQFYDLSQHGFSFYTPTPPATPNIVVELGKKPKCIYFIAKIVHCEPDSQDAQGRFRVGCRFVKRIPYWGQTGS